jgi:DNA-binding transcriptional LysR family regulator
MSVFSKDFTIAPRRIRVLREVAQRGTVTGAAAGLHLTPSAVSQQIAALSRDLGVPLLEKTGRGVRLTGQAQVILQHASVVQAQFERARADLAAFADGARGSVAVAGFSTAISGLIAPAMQLLSQRRPGIAVTAVEMDPPEVFTRLDRGELDVVVAVDHRGVPPHTDPHYHRQPLLADRFEVGLPVGHPFAARDSIELSELAGETFVAAAPQSSCAEVTLAACAAAGFTPDIRHYSSDWSAVASLVAVGCGVALVPRLAQPVVVEGFLLRPLAGVGAARNIFAAVRAGAQDDPVLAATLQVLCEVAHGLAELRASARKPVTGRLQPVEQ